MHDVIQADTISIETAIGRYFIGQMGISFLPPLYLADFCNS
jgi:hypothetical protein